jgi:YspA, cpYpsA-related SLOG family
MNERAFRVLVCGSRKWTDATIVCYTLDALRPTAIIEGCARGADRLAEHYATEAGITLVHFPARWDLHGRAAGLIRNQQMLDKGKPDLVVAFDATGKGTADMVRRANLARLPIIFRSAP